MMQNALKEYLNSKMTGNFAQSDNLLQHDAQYQALVASLLNGNLADGSSKFQQTSHLDQNRSQTHKRKQEEQCVFTASPQLALKDHNPLLNGVQQEPISIWRKHKKARLDVNQEAVNEHVFQKMLQSENSAESERDQIRAFFQHNVIPNQDQQAILNAAPQLGIDREKQLQWMRHPVPQQEMVHQATAMHAVPQQEKVHQATAMHQPGVCSHRLMQYLYHTRTRPNDNSLAYWRQFVAEFYDPCAKRRWCLSCYDKVGDHALGISPDAAMVSSWPCGICNCQSGRGFEVSFEVLPRLSKVTFEGGVVDELLFLDLPRESRFSSGLLMLECGRAVQKSVYERLQVVHEGRLRIIFSPNLKILSWEFCTRSHEIFLRRTSVAPQVSELGSAVRYYQCSIDDRESNGLSSQDVQASCNKILEAGGQIEKALNLHEVDYLGFSKKNTRFLQIADVVDSMKDLMTLCHNKGTSPIESLKSYCRGTPTKLQKKKIRGKGQKESAEGLPKDANKLMATSCGQIKSNANQSCSSINTEGFSNVPEYNPVASRDSKWQTSLNRYTSPFEGPKTSNSGLYKNSVGNGFLNSNSSMQQDAMHNLIQEFMNSRAVNRHDRDEVIWGSGKSSAVDMPSGVWGRPAAAAALGNVLGSMPVRTRQSHSNAAFTRNLSEVGGSFHGKVLLPESGFSTSNGYHDHNKFHGNDSNLNYGWKA
ncbi:probable transcriptional regulator SLK2 isoform X1 [Rosa rugosa]|uniref:probable transcriptional regulator SLK2 isoform X1 n=2 Tax=Rosa rugosa TaxID=74645 RepID=UPI002B4098E1|nr:probable transcriptional regulator SLK2 isoform X1 [Rosa rugosa]XP_062029263.1 probable transcriptional regulator SLK2 isoform X1 [Rosa rugosa]XP_062029264.1 probable transcriptional regulator SLK2 isoform X1 [Rosa rugosa]